MGGGWFGFCGFVWDGCVEGVCIVIDWEVLLFCEFW